jgi:hypothetical protein
VARDVALGSIPRLGKNIRFSLRTHVEIRIERYIRNGRGDHDDQDITLSFVAASKRSRSKGCRSLQAELP